MLYDPMPKLRTQSTTLERREGKSCAECRRSKLKCDKVFPCQACVRRGCASICPDGELTATKGNQALKNHNEALQKEIKEIKARQRELENALRVAHSQVSSEPHELLRVSQVSSPQSSSNSPESNGEPAEDEQPALGRMMGALYIGENHVVKYHGETAGTELLQGLLKNHESLDDCASLNLPLAIVQLAYAFPFGVPCDFNPVREQFTQFLPTKDSARLLTEIYYNEATWMCRPIIKREFMTQIFEPLYTLEPHESWWDKVHSHQLSVFFIVMAIGMLHAPGDEPANFLDARRYHSLSCAAMSINSLVKDSTVAAVQSLCLMLYYHHLSETYSSEVRWLILGLCDRLCSRMGLQRDGTLWNLPAEETHRRRVLFWELYVWHIWTSYVFGRPAGLLEQFADVRYPDDQQNDSEPFNDGQLSLHGWKYRYAANCVSRSLAFAFNPKQSSYSALFDLDKLIRKFPAPFWMQYPTQATANKPDGVKWSPKPDLALAQYYNLFVRESNLLYLHRSFMVRAIMLNPANPLETKYAASVMAVYRSASLIVWAMRGFQEVHPTTVQQLCAFWSGYYSACIPLAALCIKSPRCPLSKPALIELELSVPPFVSCCDDSGEDSFFTDHLMDMYRRACNSMIHVCDKQPKWIPHESAPIDGARTKMDDMYFLGGVSVVIKDEVAHDKSNNSPSSQVGSDSNSSPTGVQHQESSMRQTLMRELSGEGLGPSAFVTLNHHNNSSNHNMNNMNMSMFAEPQPQQQQPLLTMPILNPNRALEMANNVTVPAASLQSMEMFDQTMNVMPDAYGTESSSFADMDLASIMSGIPANNDPQYWDNLLKAFPNPPVPNQGMSSANPPLDDDYQRFLLDIGIEDTQQRMHL